MTKLRVTMLIFLACCSSLGAEPLMVTHLKGQANSRSGSLHLLEKLDTGAKVEISEHSEATLTSLKNGARYRLTGPCTAEIAETGVILLKGEASQIKEESGRKVSQDKPKDVSATLGGALVRDSSFYAKTAGALSRPMVAWVTDPTALGAEVRLQVQGETIFEQLVEGRNVVEVPLKPEVPATLTVTLLKSGGVDLLGREKEPIRDKTTTAKVVLLDHKVSKPLLESAQAALEDFQQSTEDASDLLISVSNLLDQGLYYDTLVLLDNPALPEEFRALWARVIKTIQDEQTP